MAVQKQDDQLELTYSNYVRTQDVSLKTCRRRWMIGRSGERGSGISVLVARHDDDNDEMTKTDLFQTIQFSMSINFCLTQLNVKTVLYQTNQFSVITQFSSIWPVDRTLLGATIPTKSVWERWQWKLYSVFPKASTFMEPLTTRLFCVISGNSLEKTYSSAEM